MEGLLLAGCNYCPKQPLSHLTVTAPLTQGSLNGTSGGRPLRCSRIICADFFEREQQAAPLRIIPRAEGTRLRLSQCVAHITCVSTHHVPHAERITRRSRTSLPPCGGGRGRRAFTIAAAPMQKQKSETRKHISFQESGGNLPFSLFYYCILRRFLLLYNRIFFYTEGRYEGTSCRHGTIAYMPIS